MLLRRILIRPNHLHFLVVYLLRRLIRLPPLKAGPQPLVAANLIIRPILAVLDVNKVRIERIRVGDTVLVHGGLARLEVLAGLGGAAGGGGFWRRGCGLALVLRWVFAVQGQGRVCSLLGSFQARGVDLLRMQNGGCVEYLLRAG